MASTSVDVPGATLNTAARQVVLANIPAPLSASRPGITCTYTNTYTPKATLTLVKQVTSGTAAPNLWTLTATGSAAPPPAGFAISGPSGSAAVTSQRVPAGSYALTEIGTGSAATGYVQDGSWVCRTGGGTAVPVTNGSVTLAEQRHRHGRGGDLHRRQPVRRRLAADRQGRRRPGGRLHRRHRQDIRRQLRLRRRQSPAPSAPSPRPPR